MLPTARPPKCHPTPPLPLPLPPPSPRILHFPRSRRTRRRKAKPPAAPRHHANPSLELTQQNYPSGKLENLFDQENDQHPTAHVDFLPSGRTENDNEDGSGDGGLEEEKWRFQAEMLRAECNLLRMEREIAVKKLEKNGVELETTLRSAVESLVSGRQKICDGENVKAVLEEEIEELAEKLEKLHKSTKAKKYQIRNCSNFDTKANLLQRHLEELDERNCTKESGQINLPFDVICDIDGDDTCGKAENKPTEKMGDHSSVLTSAANGSASTSKRMTEVPEIKCSGRCKTVIRRVVEQVRAETEQWSQMQEMLVQVRGEMEELQASRDFWENQAHSSDREIRSLKHTLEEWKEKALAYENKVDELQLELYAVKWDIQKLRADSKPVPKQDVHMLPLRKQLEKERHVLSCRMKNNHRGNEKCEIENAVEEHKQRTPEKDSAPLSLAKQLAREKKMFVHQLKENRRASRKGSRDEMSTDAKTKLYSNRITGEHSPMRDVGNLLCLARQTSRAACHLHSPPANFRTRESFRK